MELRVTCYVLYVICIISTNNYQMPKELNLNVNGENYNIHISYPNETAQDNTSEAVTPTQEFIPPAQTNDENTKFIVAPLEGKFYLTKETSEKG